MNSLLLLSLLLAATTFDAALAQSNAAAGCESTCPPKGYENFSHLCPGTVVDSTSSSRSHAICHPTPATASSNNTVILNNFRQPGYVTVIANYYTGCEAGRRESGVFAGLAQRHYDSSSGKINFVVSLKGGGNCASWAQIYRQDAIGLGYNVTPSTMPLTISDNSNNLRDVFFTPPFPHPSYVILDENLNVTFKGVGPCCGYQDYFACTVNVALTLDGMLSTKINQVYERQMAAINGTTVNTTNAPTGVPSNNNSTDANKCTAETFSDWSPCSKTCGDGGIQFRYRANRALPVETRQCPNIGVIPLPECMESCVVPEFGPAFIATVVATGFDSPRDLAFHPSPGIHLGNYSEGRTFHPNEGEELWVVNGNNHSVSIIASLGSVHQTTFSRSDRGRYHYMNNITALAFNTMKSTKRLPDQDTYGYFAICNDNLNNYVGTKESNYFMGPTLYDSDVVNKGMLNATRGGKNTVNRMGDSCGDKPYDECFFLHADMLHEAPACIGIAHDPEDETSFGTVFWAFDTIGDNRTSGQLVRFDFSQPHGPGSMDHSIANVRRYPEVKLYRDKENVHGHAGMVVHPTKRVLYIANPGKGTIVAVDIDTGKYSRTAREEYPIFTNKLPSFEYSIYECVDQDKNFVSGLNNPTGLALSSDGARLFVAERTGRILAYDVESGMLMQSIDVPTYTSIGGLAISPTTGALYFADMNSNNVVKIDANAVQNGTTCVYSTPVDENYQLALVNGQNSVDLLCGKGTFSLTRGYNCSVSGAIPNGTLFEQVHLATGYASTDPNVQSPLAGMDVTAALLANRTDCEANSVLNFDQLLLGGYFCHRCLPALFGDKGSTCDAGGICANVQWDGFTCNNEYFVDYNTNTSSMIVSSLFYNASYPMAGGKLVLDHGVTYRFTVRSTDRPVSIVANISLATLGSGTMNGPVFLKVDNTTPPCLYLTSHGIEPMILTSGVVDCALSTSNPSTAMPSTAMPSTATPSLGTIEITVSGGVRNSSPYYTFHVGGSPIDIASYEFIRGGRYKFIGGSTLSSSHPFFVSDQGRVTASSSISITSTRAYNTGIRAGESLEFQLPSDFSKTLTYYCVPHSEMTNMFKIAASPTVSPTSLRPTIMPSPEPTTLKPTTVKPSLTPSTAKPTASPTATPTASPTQSPTNTPTAIPTASPTASPNATPTASPTKSPTNTPTAAPTLKPTTSKPTTSKPTTPKPTTSKPTTSKPKTSNPTSKPTTSKPTTSKPTTSKPTTSKPTTSKPTSKPKTFKPTTAAPTLKPTTTKPTTSKPTSLKPMTLKPTTRKPRTRKPTTSKPTTSKPII